MTIITQDYVLTTMEDMVIEKQRQAMDSFEFSLGCAISASHLMDGAKILKYLPIRTLYPEHNENLYPLLLAKQVRNGFDEKRIREEGNLRRLYQLGRSVVAVRCVPDFEKQIDELHFIFSGMYSRDIAPAVQAIEGIVSETNKLNSGALQWYREQ